ncbi:unnamed protein product, partial [Phaeothamnion confervicola]
AAILVVEDHAATRMAVMALLAGAFPGCRLIGADSAEVALPLCEREAPRVVIMDIALPGMNGIEATRLIKARHPGIRVVMHSSNDMQIFRDESVAVGASAFVGKGTRSGELVPVLAGLL